MARWSAKTFDSLKRLESATCRLVSDRDSVLGDSASLDPFSPTPKAAFRLARVEPSCQRAVNRYNNIVHSNVSFFKPERVILERRCFFFFIFGTVFMRCRNCFRSFPRTILLCYPPDVHCVRYIIMKPHNSP